MTSCSLYNTLLSPGKTNSALYRIWVPFGTHNITPASHGTHWESSSGWRTICPLLRSTHWFGCGFQEAVGSHSSIYPFPCHTWVLLGIGISSKFSKMHGLLAVQSPCDWWCQSHLISLGVGGGWRPWMNSNYILYYYHTNGWNWGDHVGGNGNGDFDIPYLDWWSLNCQIQNV